MEKTVRPYLAEMLGTFAVVFVSAGAVCANALTAISWGSDAGAPDKFIVQSQLGLPGIALAVGLIYAVTLAITVPLSGGYLNPVIPLVLWVFKKMDSGRTVLLIALQLVGAALAGALLRLVLGSRLDVLTTASLGTPHLDARFFATSGPAWKMWLSGAGMEFGLTAILTFVIFGVLIDTRSRTWLGQGKRSACLWVGLAYAATTLVAFPLTGAAFNPARWFGTVIWESSIPTLQNLNPMRDHLVFWFGPIAGALVAGLVYTTMILPTEEEGEQQ